MIWPSESELVPHKVAIRAGCYQLKLYRIEIFRCVYLFP